MSKILHKEPGTSLYEALLTLETQEECQKFLADLCTVSELKAMQQRMEVALLLNEGRIYNYILASAGASSATISRVNRCLHYGAGGYQTVIPRLLKKRNEQL